MEYIDIGRGIFLAICCVVFGVGIRFTVMKYRSEEVPDSVYRRLIYKRKQFQKLDDPMQEAWLHQQWLKEVLAIIKK